jgi:3-dehydroquinate synthase class II
MSTWLENLKAGDLVGVVERDGAEPNIGIVSRVTTGRKWLYLAPAPAGRAGRTRGTLAGLGASSPRLLHC